MQGGHLCEDCVFFEMCTPFEQQVDNFDFNCGNYRNYDFIEDEDDLNYRDAWSVNSDKYEDTFWDYEEDEE